MAPAPDGPAAIRSAEPFPPLRWPNGEKPSEGFFERLQRPAREGSKPHGLRTENFPTKHGWPSPTRDLDWKDTPAYLCNRSFEKPRGVFAATRERPRQRPRFRRQDRKPCPYCPLNPARGARPSWRSSPLSFPGRGPGKKDRLRHAPFSRMSQRARHAGAGLSEAILPPQGNPWLPPGLSGG